ncbi:hypothetical protein ACJJTC_006474 [Scirpophaga incertulas]
MDGTSRVIGMIEDGSQDLRLEVCPDNMYKIRRDGGCREGGCSPSPSKPLSRELISNFLPTVLSWDVENEPAIVDGPIAGPSSEEPLIVIVPEELSKPESDIEDDGRTVENEARKGAKLSLIAI